MRNQLDQMELTQTENRYETQRQAQRPQQAQQREQLQVLNRLQELARRQQDVNERLKDLQSALQEAKTDQEREELKRRLKRLQLVQPYRQSTVKRPPRRPAGALPRGTMPPAPPGRRSPLRAGRRAPSPGR